MRVFLFSALLVAGLAGCSSPESSSPSATIYVDTVIPRKVNRVPVVAGETPTLGRAIDAIGGLLPEEKDGYIQILRGEAPPVVIPVRDFSAHRDDVLKPGDSVYVGLKAQ